MSSFRVGGGPTMRSKRIFRTRRRCAAAAAEACPPRLGCDAGRRGGGTAGWQCPRAWAQISVTYVAAARRAIPDQDEWITIGDEPGLAAPKGYGQLRSRARRSHGSPRPRAPPRSGPRGSKHAWPTRPVASVGLARSGASAPKSSRRRLFPHPPCGAALHPRSSAHAAVIQPRPAPVKATADGVCAHG
jgi:hypothetical protein